MWGINSSTSSPPTTPRRPPSQSLKDLITCPITQEVMEEPVVLSDGHTYEKDSILRWLRSHSTSPMTNLPLSNTTWFRNHAVEKIIQAYKEGSLDDMNMNDDIPSQIRPRPILLSKSHAAYLVVSDYALLYTKWDFVDVKFDLFRGDVLWTTARYRYGDEVFVAVENYGYICERDIRITSYSTEPFVIQAIENIGYRFLPNNNLSARIDGNVSLMKEVVVSGNISIKSPSGVTYYYIDGLHRGFVFDRSLDGQILLKTISIEKMTSSNPWVLEIMTSIALRKQPDYDKRLRLSSELQKDAMIASSKRVVGQHDDHFYWVKVGDVSGWVFATRQGETFMRVLLSVPKPISLTPGEGILLACDRIDRWVLILNKEDTNNHKTQSFDWSSDAPYSVSNQINNCTRKGRRITGVAFRDDWWYVSGEKLDGSGGYCWGNVPEISCKAKVAIGAFDPDYGEHSYAVCHENGDSDNGNLPSGLLDTMDEATTIENVFISDENDYFIRYNQGWTSWSISNQYLRNEVKNKKKGNVLSIAIFDDGTWIVIRDLSFRCSNGTPDELESLLQKHYDDQKKIIFTQRARIASFRNAVATFVE